MIKLAHPVDQCDGGRDASSIKSVLKASLIVSESGIDVVKRMI